MAPNETGKDATAAYRMSKSKSGKNAVFTKRKLIKPFEFSPGAIEAYKGYIETPQTSGLTPGAQEHEGAYLQNGRWCLSRNLERILREISRQNEDGEPGVMEACKGHSETPQSSALTPGVQEDKVYDANGIWYLRKEVDSLFSQLNLQEQSRQKEFGKSGAIEANKEHFEKPQTSAIMPGAQEDIVYDANDFWLLPRELAMTIGIPRSNVQEQSRQNESGEDATVTNRNVKKPSPATRAIRREDIASALEDIGYSQADICKALTTNHMPCEDVAFAMKILGYSQTDVDRIKQGGYRSLDEAMEYIRYGPSAMPDEDMKEMREDGFSEEDIESAVQAGCNNSQQAWGFLEVGAVLPKGFVFPLPSPLGCYKDNDEDDEEEESDNDNEEDDDEEGDNNNKEESDNNKESDEESSEESSEESDDDDRDENERVASPLLEQGLSDFPSGWEQRHTLENRAYFVDHNTRTTTWVDPRGQQYIETYGNNANGSTIRQQPVSQPGLTNTGSFYPLMTSMSSSGMRSTSSFEGLGLTSSSSQRRSVETKLLAEVTFEEKEGMDKLWHGLSKSQRKEMMQLEGNVVLERIRAHGGDSGTERKWLETYNNRYSER